MAELLQVKKQKEVNIKIKKDMTAPELSSIVKGSFEEISKETLKQALEDKGVVIPDNILKDISTAYHKIGKEYWLTVNKFKI